MEIFLPDEEESGSCLLDGKTILIEKDLLYLSSGLGRHNFTVAHECAHHIMKMLYPAYYGGRTAARECREHRLYARSDDWDREEWQMDFVASTLLMPRDLLERNMALAGCPGGIPVLNPVWRKEDYGRFAGLSRMMGVSEQALAFRLQQLGLLGSNQLYRPNAMIDIWMTEEEAV